MRPGEFEDPVRQVSVLVLAGQAGGRLPVRADAIHHVDCGGLLGFERDAVADCDDRIQDRAIGSRKGGVLAHRLRGHNALFPADKTHAVGFVGYLSGHSAAHGHQVEHPRRVLVDRTGAARAYDRTARSDDLGLDEQVAERRVRRIRQWCGEHDLRVARDVDLATGPRTIGDSHPAQFNVVFRGDDNLGMGLVFEIAAPELCPSLRKDRLIGLCRIERRLMRIRPERAAREVADVAESAPVVACCVLAPTRHREIFPAAVAATGIGHQNVIAAIGQELHFGGRGVPGIEGADRHRRVVFLGAQGGDISAVRLCTAGLRHPLLQQQGGCPEDRNRHEAPLHRPIEQHVGER